MHYYTFHIGDYTAHTARLSPMEDLAYRRMLDAYYLAERPLSGCSTDVALDIGLSDHLAAVERVLGKFFVLTDAGYSHVRCDEEIAKYRSKVEKASAAGKASAERKANKRIANVEEKSTDVQRTLDACSTNVQPTNNHKPITNNQERVARKRGYTLREWLEKNDEEGRDDIPADGCVMAYANNLHIPAELVVIAWYAYVDKYTKEGKRYANWDLAFLNCVKDGGYGIWRHTPDGYVLTTKGLQAEAAMNAELRARG